MDLLGYVNHSGGAKGADTEWDMIGRPFGVKTTHWRPEHLSTLSPEGRKKMLEDVKNAALVLKRPYQFKGIELVQRNWFQSYNAKAIYAVSYIIKPGDTDFKGFVNNSGKEIVFGGTGWAVEMGIQMGKHVYVFNMLQDGSDSWHVWNYDHGKFWPTFTPELTKSFAGIGSRVITEEAKDAIKKVYERTAEIEKAKKQ